MRWATNARRVSASSASSAHSRRVVEPGDLAAQWRVDDPRPVDRRPRQRFTQHARLEVDDPLPVAARRRGAAVVDDARRQHGDHRRLRGALVPVEVVPDGPCVDEEERPDVVDVGRVGVRREGRGQCLADTRDRGLPRNYGRGFNARRHRRIVQDRRRAAAYGREMGTLIGLIGFSIVSSVTPGPNNVLLLASGSTFGFRRTAPHILGTAVGIGVMALAVGAGRLDRVATRGAMRHAFLYWVAGPEGQAIARVVRLPSSQPRSEPPRRSCSGARSASYRRPHCGGRRVPRCGRRRAPGARRSISLCLDA